MFTTQKITAVYDQIGLYFSATRQHLSKEVISLLPACISCAESTAGRPKLPAHARILDLGCGNGVLLTALDRRSLSEGGSINYTGIDISRAMIDEARSRLAGPNTKFLLADITDPALWPTLPRYDFIAALAVFHHLPRRADHLALLSQIKNHLQPGGTALISIWNLKQPKFDQFRVNHRHYSIPFHKGPCRDFYALSETELVSLAKQTGLTAKKISRTKNNLYLTVFPQTCDT